MSVARVHVVHMAAKDQGKCEKCGTPLPKGSAYRWWTVGFRSRGKHKRCMASTCTPRESERESSMLSEVMAAQEDARKTLDSLGSTEAGDPEGVTDDAKAALEGVADACDSVAEAYREQGNYFGGYTDNTDRADALDDASSTLRDWEPSGDAPDACEAHDEYDPECDDCRDNWDQWLSDMLSEATDVVDGVELP